jgi:uncharacterized protein (DUF4415 family)
MHHCKSSACSLNFLLRESSSVRPEPFDKLRAGSLPDEGDTIRAISMRKGNKHERKIYQDRVKTASHELAKLQKMTDHGIDYSDIPPTDAKFLEKAQVVLPPVKTHLSLRFDEDIVEWFRRQGAGYQTKINAVLRSYVQAHSAKGKT